jgi:hypothetical protein
MIAPTPKKETAHRAAGAKGGSTHMLPKQAAGPAAPGRSGKIPSPAPGAKSAKGGPPTRGVSLATPAKPGRTSQVVKGR